MLPDFLIKKIKDKKLKKESFEQKFLYLYEDTIIEDVKPKRDAKEEERGYAVIELF